VHQNSRKVIELVEDARRETVRVGMAAEGEIMVRQRFVPADYTVNYKIMEGTGADRRVVDVNNAQILIKPEATLLRQRPFAYILPRDAVDAVAMLQRHNILVEVLQEPVQLEVQAYVLDGIRYSSHFGHPASTFVSVGEVVNVTRNFPRGTYVVPTGQVMGRIAAYLLEAETGDNVVVWNAMDAWLPKARFGPIGPPGGSNGNGASADQQGPPGQQQQQPAFLPIFKVMQPAVLPTRMLRN